jgi:hypothetical protein
MELTYGGRLTAAPHNHGVRARRTRTVHAFWMVLEGSPQALPLTVFLPDGKEALALFSGEEEAMMFCHFCEKGASANLRQTTTGEVISLLYCPWCAAKHVALDPFPEILGGRLLLGVLRLEREEFALRFAGLGSEPVARPPWHAPRAPLLAAR